MPLLHTCAAIVVISNIPDTFKISTSYSFSLCSFYLVLHPTYISSGLIIAVGAGITSKLSSSIEFTRVNFFSLAKGPVLLYTYVHAQHVINCS